MASGACASDFKTPPSDLVSYLPYQPDVWPPISADTTPPRSDFAKWIFFSVLYLLAVAGFAFWMKLPPRLQEPLATFSLSGRHEVRLIHATLGKQLALSRGNTFGNRIRASEDLGGSRTFGDSAGGGAWLLFSHYDKYHGSFAVPDLRLVEVLEPGSPYPLRPSRIEVGNGPYSVALFPTIPRDSGQLTIRVNAGAHVITQTVPNPFFGMAIPRAEPSPFLPATSPAPAPLPQQLTADDFTVRFEGVKFREIDTPGLSFGRYKAEPQLKVTHASVAPSHFSHTWEWFDASGNTTGNGILPWSSSPWGLRVRISERESFPVPEHRITRLGVVKAPGPGQVIALPVPPFLAATGTTDVLLIGTGNYTWSGKQLMSQSTQPVRAVITVGATRFGSITESAWGVYLLGRTNRTLDRPRAKLRVRVGDDTATHNSSGSATYNELSHQHFGNYRLPKTGAIPAGQEITIDAIAPKIHTFEFQAPRPDFSR